MSVEHLIAKHIDPLHTVGEHLRDEEEANSSVGLTAVGSTRPTLQAIASHARDVFNIEEPPCVYRLAEFR
eukprot:2672206-Alexandrium_andersonii.AAC.1